MGSGSDGDVAFSGSSGMGEICSDSAKRVVDNGGGEFGVDIFDLSNGETCHPGSDNVIGRNSLAGGKEMEVEGVCGGKYTNSSLGFASFNGAFRGRGRANNCDKYFFLWERKR